MKHLSEQHSAFSGTKLNALLHEHLKFFLLLKSDVPCVRHLLLAPQVLDVAADCELATSVQYSSICDVTVSVMQSVKWMAVRLWDGRTDSVIQTSPCSTKLLQWQLIRIIVYPPDRTSSMRPWEPRLPLLWSSHVFQWPWARPFRPTRVLPPHSVSEAQIFTAP
jgi:hypothetical protein